MNYDLTMYNEDIAISCFVYSKKFKNLTFLKDDLIQCSLIALYRYREKYDNTKGTYFTYANKISYFVMLSFIRKEKKCTNNFDNLSIDFEYNEDCTFLDILGEEFDFDTTFNYEYLLKVCNEVIDKNKSKLLKNISKLYIVGKKPAQVAKELNISRQCACVYIDKFKKLVQDKLKEYDFELQTNICNKKVIQ